MQYIYIIFVYNEELKGDIQGYSLGLLANHSKFQLLPFGCKRYGPCRDRYGFTPHRGNLEDYDFHIAQRLTSFFETCQPSDKCHLSL